MASEPSPVVGQANDTAHDVTAIRPLLLTVLLAVVVGTTAASMYSSGDGYGVMSRRWTRRQVLTAVTSACAVATLAIGLADALGLSVLWLVVLLTACSPRADPNSRARYEGPLQL